MEPPETASPVNLLRQVFVLSSRESLTTPASEIPPAEVALSFGVLVLSTFLTVWIAARIYRVGILMYGKRPSVREMIRWARET